MNSVSDPIKKRIKKEHPLYQTWEAMKSRCHNKNKKRFDRYGGRGITVCERWKNDFWAFVEDVGQKPSSKHSIDRIDNDGNYAPGNVRWATWNQQATNKAPRSSSSIVLEYGGKAMMLREWSAHLNINQYILSRRLKLGWSVEKTLSTPLKTYSKKPSPRGWDYEGRWYSVREFAARAMIPEKTMLKRYEKGWDAERALKQKYKTRIGRAN